MSQISLSLFPKDTDLDIFLCMSCQTGNQIRDIQQRSSSEGLLADREGPAWYIVFKVVAPGSERKIKGSTAALL